MLNKLRCHARFWLLANQIILIHVVDAKSQTEWQTVQIQIICLQNLTYQDLHCLQRQSISRFSRTRVNSLFNCCIYPKYLGSSTSYHICSKIWTCTIYYLKLCLKIAGWVANSVDPDEMLHSAASHLGLHCLLRPLCPNTAGKYGNSVS